MKIEESFGKCQKCEKEAVLGNGICTDCWDWAINHDDNSYDPKEKK